MLNEKDRKKEKLDDDNNNNGEMLLKIIWEILLLNLCFTLS